MKKRMWKKAAAVSMAAALVMPAAVSADSDVMDELTAISEAQAEMVPESLMERTLGFSELGDAVEEKGFSVQTQFGVKNDTADLLGAADVLKDGNYAKMNFQLDPVQKKYQFDFGVGQSADTSLMDLSLYGEDGLLALSIPQFYEGALALTSGKFAEQYAASAAQELFGTLPQGIDMDMHFYPTDEELDGLFSTSGGFEEMLENYADELQESMTAEKSEADGETIYTVTCPVDKVFDLYRGFISELSNLMMSTGAVTVSDVSEFEEQFEEILDMTELAMDDELVMNYHVVDNLITKLDFSMTMDMNEVMALNDIEGEVLPESASIIGGADGPTSVFVAGKTTSSEEEPLTEAAAEQAEETPAADTYDPANVMTMNYEIVYRDPADVSQGYDMTMTGADGTGAGIIDAVVSMTKEETETSCAYSMRMTMKGDGETLYDGEVFRTSFDAATGEFDIIFSVEADGQTAGYVFESAFENIVKGQSFDLRIDNLAMRMSQGDTVTDMGLEGRVSVSADPGEITAPASVRKVLELTQDELMDLLMEVQTKATEWSQQFEDEEPDVNYGAETELAEG